MSEQSKVAARRPPSKKPARSATKPITSDNSLEPASLPTSNGDEPSTHVGRPLRKLAGGQKRQRRGAGMSRLGASPKIIPAELALARGYQFSTARATPAQERHLKELVTKYM